jgi:hypothetical protein
MLLETFGTWSKGAIKRKQFWNNSRRFQYTIPGQRAEIAQTRQKTTPIPWESDHIKHTFGEKREECGWLARVRRENYKIWKLGPIFRCLPSQNTPTSFLFRFLLGIHQDSIKEINWYVTQFRRMESKAEKSGNAIFEKLLPFWLTPLFSFPLSLLLITPSVLPYIKLILYDIPFRNKGTTLDFGPPVQLPLILFIFSCFSEPCLFFAFYFANGIPCTIIELCST